MQYIYPCSSSGRLWWTPARKYNHVWSVDDSCEDLPGSMGLRDLLWSHRISCLHHHCQMGEFLSIVLSNIFSVFLLLLIILFHLLFFIILLLSYLLHLLHDLHLLSSPFWTFFSSFSPSPVLFSFSLVSSSSILSSHSSFSATISPFRFSSPSFAPSLSSHHQINQSLSWILSVTILWTSLLFQLQKMKQLRAVYPEKTVYTQQVGPGCCFGALALMLRFYFEVTIKLKLILTHKY